MTPHSPHSNHLSKYFDSCKSPTRYHVQSRDQSRQASFGLTERHRIKNPCNCKKAMICVYCDNPRDKCTCRAPIGKCSRCGLSSDVCDCRNDGGDNPGCKPGRIASEPDESRTIQITSWKPKREIRRYFARDPADLYSDTIEECRCCERLNWQRPEELPYQRLNVFSDVMNELQQKMSESVCCTRCRRNPCRCGSQVDQDERVEGRKANGYVKYVRLLGNLLERRFPLIQRLLWMNISETTERKFKSDLVKNKSSYSELSSLFNTNNSIFAFFLLIAPLIRCPETKKLPRSKLPRDKSPKKKSPRNKSSRKTSPNNCRCDSSPGNERKSTVNKSSSTCRVCICKLSPCRCRRRRPSHRRPLAKCYYCKSLPCT